MPVAEWDLLETEVSFEAQPWLKVCRDTVQLPGGRVVDDFYRVEMPDFVVVVALTVQNEIVMARSYKHGLGRVCLTTPAGFIDPGEDALSAGRRELLEETGYSAEEWHCLGQFVVDGTRHCGTMHLLVATGARATAEPQVNDMEELDVQLHNGGRSLAGDPAGRSRTSFYRLRSGAGTWMAGPR